MPKISRRLPRRLTAVAALAVAVAAILTACAPSAPTPPTPMSSAERTVIVQHELDQLWISLSGNRPNAARPHPRVVRYLTSEEATVAFATCMANDGYATDYAAKNGITVSQVGISNQIPQYLASFTCQAEYPEDPIEQGYMTIAQARYLDTYWTNSLVPCLRGAGIRVPPMPLVIDYDTGRRVLGRAWDPYAYVASSRGTAGAAAVYRLCPKYPPGFIGSP